MPPAVCEYLVDHLAIETAAAAAAKTSFEVGSAVADTSTRQAQST